MTPSAEQIRQRATWLRMTRGGVIAWLGLAWLALMLLVALGMTGAGAGRPLLMMGRSLLLVSLAASMAIGFSLLQLDLRRRIRRTRKILGTRGRKTAALSPAQRVAVAIAALSGMVVLGATASVVWGVLERSVPARATRCRGGCLP
mgnify:CR=1 FL=1